MLLKHAGHIVGGATASAGHVGPQPPTQEDPCGIAALRRISGAIDYSHSLLDRLQNLEARLNGDRPISLARQEEAQKVACEGYASSLLGDMYRAADSTEALASKLEQTILALERFV